MPLRKHEKVLVECRGEVLAITQPGYGAYELRPRTAHTVGLGDDSPASILSRFPAMTLTQPVILQR